MQPSRTLVVGLAVALGLPAAAPAQQSSARFDAPVVAIGPQQRFESIVDLDLDGDLDFVGWWWQGNYYADAYMGLWLNDGAGGLVEVTTTSTLLNSPSEKHEQFGYAHGDLTGEGLPDLYFGLGTSQNLRVNPGAGGFINWYGGPPATGIIRGAAIADFVPGGAEELVVYESNNVRFFRFDNDTGQLVTLSNVATGVFDGQLTLMDVDGVGEPDLVITTATQVHMFPVTGVNLGAPTVFPHSAGMPMPAAGDIDGDGDEDFVVFDMTDYEVYRRDGLASFSHEPVQVGGPATHLIDADGDGDLDGMCCGSGGESAVYNVSDSVFRISYNDGSGAFAPAYELPGMGAHHLAGAADVDKDGDVDLVGGRCIYYAREPLTEGAVPTVGTRAQTPRTVHDVDGDGDPDFEPGAAGRFQNRGDGSTGLVAPLVPDPPPGTYFLGPGYNADVDGDGDADLLVEQRDASDDSFLTMRLLRNTGGGAYLDGGPATAAAEPIEENPALPGGDPDSVLVADADGDGHLDLIHRTTWNYSRFWWNDGSGYFTRDAATQPGIVRHVADFNQDGAPDLCLAYKYSSHEPEIATARGLGARAFDAPVDLFWPMRINQYTDRWAVSDVDGDGYPDLVAADKYGDLWFHRNNQNPEIRFNYYQIQDRALQAYDFPRSVLLVDVDGDGFEDIVASGPGYYLGSGQQYYAPAASVVFLRQGASTTWLQDVDRPLQIVHASAVADVDGDGDQDLLSTHCHVNTLHDGRTGGRRVQYGAGVPGTGGMTPTLGVTGPFRPGETKVVRVTGGLGGAIAIVFTDREERVPFGGDGVPLVQRLERRKLVLSGVKGEPGTGAGSFPRVVPPESAGRTYLYRARVRDAGAPDGWSWTNVTRVEYGY